MAGWIKTPKWDNLMAFDTETTINSNKLIGPDPRHYTNRVVLLGLVTNGAGWIREYPTSHVVNVWTPPWGAETTINPDHYVVCGHNVKFDLHAISALDKGKTPISLMAVIENDGEIWDTQVGAYLISGQRMVSPSLEEAAEQAGVVFTKDPEVKLAFEHGIGADKIDHDMLVGYLKEDCETTYLVAKWQIEECQRLGLMPLAVSMMRAVRELFHIERVGMWVDAKACSERKAINEATIRQARLDMLHHLARVRIPPVFIDKFNPSSNQQLALLISGGQWQYEERVPDGNYKNGNPRFTTVTRTVYIPSACLPSTQSLFKGNVDTEFLDSVIAATGNADTLCNALVEYKKYAKLNSTYIEPIRERATEYGGKIHPNFNPTITKTGRLSASNPNFQNMAGGGEDSAKQVFVPRHGHVFIELDYKQMEVVALYLQSKCKDLGNALKSGVDIHNETGRKALGRIPADEERRSIKAVNFGLIYGGGAKTLSGQSGLDLATTKSCIEAFFNLYPGVKRWREEFIKGANSSEPLFDKPVLGGKPYEYRQVVSPTGRIITFGYYERDPNRPWTKDGISPTEGANYPIQSLATGDISQTMLWVLGSLLRKKYKGVVNIVNTVHDSYLVECPTEMAAEVRTYCVQILESADEIVNRLFGIVMDVKFKVDAKMYTQCWGGK